MSGCALCENGGPLLCDTHSQHAILKRQGYEDALATFAHTSIAELMRHETKATCDMYAADTRGDWNENSYLAGRVNALNELINKKIE